MKYIEELREGERVNAIYLCKQRNVATTKTGKEYENLILQDKTGQLDGKIWEPNSFGIGDFDAFDYVEVSGRVTSFNGALQLSIERARKCDEGEYNEADYLPVSTRNVEEMYAELLKYVDSVTNADLKALLKKFFVEDEEFIRAFKQSSAAKSVHHGFVGGLLEHTISVANLCNAFAANYQLLNRDLLISAALVHDMGKIKEFSKFPLNDYTDDGQLLGHIVMGIEMVNEKLSKLPDFPAKLASELKHCILSHHGEYEYGAPKRPSIVEAFALHFADNMDAKMETIKEMFETTDSNDWLGFSRVLDTNIRKTSI
ncbi:MAG: HD domain-containing protein [Lachnospiraceae bacterium]|nr:HD domain-containing protein [Lachnospiraceae bacterium]